MFFWRGDDWFDNKKYDPQEEAKRKEEENWAKLEKNGAGYFEKDRRVVEKEKAEAWKKTEKARNAIRRRERWWAFIRRIGRWLAPRVFSRFFPSMLQKDGETGRLRYEKIAANLYFDYGGIISKVLIVILVALLVTFFAYTPLVTRYNDYLLGAEPAVHTAFDDLNTFVENMRTLRALDNTSFVDRHVLTWIRSTPLIELKNPVQVSKFVEYTWFNGKRYNTTVTELRRVAGTTFSDKCSCAAHFGVPLNIAFLGRKMWIESRFIQVPDRSVAGMRRKEFNDLLAGDVPYFLILPQWARAEFLTPSGIAKEDLKGSDLACVTRCMDFASRKSTFEDLWNE